MGMSAWRMARLRQVRGYSTIDNRVAINRASAEDICTEYAGDRNRRESMAQVKAKSRPSLWGAVKEVFNWYPSAYPAEERKLLFKLDVSILVFACLCCMFVILQAFTCIKLTHQSSSNSSTRRTSPMHTSAA
jgi:hypothetical protein